MSAYYNGCKTIRNIYESVIQSFVLRMYAVSGSNERFSLKLTRLSLASLLWDIGKQNSPRCDAAERGVSSGAIPFAYRNFIKKME